MALAMNYQCPQCRIGSKNGYLQQVCPQGLSGGPPVSLKASRSYSGSLQLLSL